MTSEEVRDTLVATLDGMMEILDSEEVSVGQRIEAARLVHEIVRHHRRLLTEDEVTEGNECQPLVGTADRGMS